MPLLINHPNTISIQLSEFSNQIIIIEYTTPSNTCKNEDCIKFLIILICNNYKSFIYYVLVILQYIYNLTYTQTHLCSSRLLSLSLSVSLFFCKKQKKIYTYMAAEVSCMVRSLINGGDAKESPTAPITRDFLAGYCTLDSQELDLDLQVPSGWEKRLDLKVYIYIIISFCFSSINIYFRKSTYSGFNLTLNYVCVICSQEKYIYRDAILTTILAHRKRI